jgi:hypothetical protein
MKIGHNKNVKQEKKNDQFTIVIILAVYTIVNFKVDCKSLVAKTCIHKFANILN